MTRVVAFRTASWLAVLVSVLLLAPATEAYAQRITGELSGTVADTSGGSCRGRRGPHPRGLARHAPDGDQPVRVLRVRRHSAGTYTLTVTMPGFNTHEVTDIVLQGGDSRTVRTIALELATVAEAVSVSAQVALTPLTSARRRRR